MSTSPFSTTVRSSRQGSSALHGAAGAERRLLHGVADLQAERAAVAEHRLDALGAIGHGEDHVAHAGAPQEVELVAQEGPVHDRHDGLRQAERQRAQPRAFAARENDCSHELGVSDNSTRRFLDGHTPPSL